MDIYGKASLMFVFFSPVSIVNYTEVLYSSSLGGEIGEGGCGHLRCDQGHACIMCVSLCICVHPLLACKCRMRMLSVSPDSAHLLLIHAFAPFLYAKQCLDMKRAILIGDCFLCRFRSTLPHWEFTENNNSTAR